MIDYIKNAVSTKITPKKTELFNAIVCSIYTMINEDINPFGKIFDIAEIAEIGMETMRNASYNLELSECTPLDYSELYGITFGGNTLLFLRNYQNYFGPIE